MQGLVVEKQGSKVRVNSRTWVVHKQDEPVVQSQAVLFKGEKKKDLFIANRAEILALDLERKYKRVVRFAGEHDVFLGEHDSPSQKDTLALLMYMGRRAVVKKLLLMKKDKMYKYISNPFLLYLDGHLDFHSARVISLRTLLPAALKDRVQAYLYYIIDEAYKNGRESITMTDAVFELSSVLGMDEDEVEKILNEIKRNGKQRGRKRLFLNDAESTWEPGRAYLAWVYFLKTKALSMLNNNTPIDPPDTDDENIKELLSYRYAILTGDPGTGKTTLLKKLARTPNGTCILAGLTGKAAQRLGGGAVTVHSLLGYGPKGFSVKQLSCDTLIIDEASMINWRTLYAVFTAAPRVIFAGDPKQLPPVEGENVFKEMMEILPVVRLEKTWRFKNGLDVETVKKDSEKKIFAALDNLIGKLKGKDFQVITPIHGGLLGTAYLNEYMQKACNPKKESLEGIKKGDKIIVNQNVYTSARKMIAANGTVGMVYDMATYDNIAHYLVDTPGGRVLLGREHIELAYALTVHKYQGSECDYIIFVIPDRGKIREDFITEEMITVGKTRGRMKTYVLEVEDAGKRPVQDCN